MKSPNHGCEEPRRDGSYLGRSRGIQIHPRQVIGSGAEYLYGLVAQFFGAGCIFGIENPSYEKIRKVYESMGIVCDPLTLSAEGIVFRAYKDESIRTACNAIQQLSERITYWNFSQKRRSSTGETAQCRDRGR